jgi:hypothetical protein
LFERNFTVRVAGVSGRHRVLLLFKSVFDPRWYENVSVDADMQAVVSSRWDDVIVTVVVDGVVIGSASLDRRLSRTAFTVSVDQDAKRVSAEPGIEGRGVENPRREPPW